MATVKKASTASKKSAAGKKSSKKVVVAKKAAPKSSKEVKKTAAKKVAPAKSKPSASKAEPAKKKTAVSPKASVKKVVIAKKLTSKVAPTPTKKVVAASKKVVAPSKKTIDKKASDKKSNTTSNNTEAKKKVPAKDIELTVKVSPSTKSEKVAPKKAETSKPAKAAKEPVAVGKNEEKLEPLQAKAQKVMKELEETMDLSKVRPRIQAGTTPTPTPRPVIRMKEPPLKLVEPTNTTKVKYQLEFEFRSSPKILFNCLSDAGGLAGWFADEVKTKDSIYTFVWEGGESYAKLVGLKDLHLVRFQWLDDTDGTYFQFEIKEDDITTDIALEITDFANPGEKETAMRLWESQVQKLRMLLGSL
jgi:hypothetical protein